MPAGSSFVVPQGLVHWVINLGCKEAQLVASFPTRDPGTSTVLPTIFNDQVPDNVVRAATGLDNDAIKNIREKVSNCPAGMLSCLQHADTR